MRRINVCGRVLWASLAAAMLEVRKIAESRRAVCSALMPFASQPAAERVTSRDKRRIAAVVAAILLLLAAVAVWAAVRPGAYGSSKDGCITVTIPGSTGGQLIHQCGAGARSLCKRAYAGTDKASMLTRPQCRLAGITVR